MLSNSTPPLTRLTSHKKSQERLRDFIAGPRVRTYLLLVIFYVEDSKLKSNLYHEATIEFSSEPNVKILLSFQTLPTNNEPLYLSRTLAIIQQDYLKYRKMRVFA